MTFGVLVHCQLLSVRYPSTEYICCYFVTTDSSKSASIFGYEFEYGG